MIPAIPPEDYKGTNSDWTIALINGGFWNGIEPSWYGDVELEDSDWWDILEQCEQ